MRFEMSARMLSGEERAALAGSLERHGVDEAVWDVYGSFLSSSSGVTRPRVLRAFEGGRLAGAAFLVLCRGGGRSLFRNALLAFLVDLPRIPNLLWLRQGICADLMANPGFAAEGRDEGAVVAAMAAHLRRESPALFVTDLEGQEALHGGAVKFPYAREGAVEVKGMKSVEDFLRDHGRLRRKLKTFEKKGGTIEVLRGPLDGPTRDEVLRCVRATMEASFVRTPFQDHFPEMIARSCAIASDRLLTFVARLEGRFAGYHAFVRTGKGLRMLHGAFDRTLPSTHHAYENLITGNAAYAIEEGLEAVHFGPVMNETKRRMMNRAEKANIYFSSSNPLLRALMPALLRRSSMQSPRLLAFS